ncbi:MAG: antibiotic biosynthesis monooxygenase [Bacteroidaceae bacterium]|nr:antibiotic biosynthesis monooxygenase [Bacteroidaceae bacterium]
MIRINCFYQANEGQYDAALQAALALTAASQKHEGCVSYDVFESGTRADIFMFCETWTSAEALAAHAATEEYAIAKAQLESCGKMKLERFEF